jgi:hypothetical protein
MRDMENEWKYVFIDELEDEVTLKGVTHVDDDGFNEVWETIAVFNEEHREVLEWMISEIHRLKYALRMQEE